LHMHLWQHTTDVLAAGEEDWPTFDALCAQIQSSCSGRIYQ
jgi:hypothetical protein